MFAAFLASRYAKPALYGLGVGLILVLLWVALLRYGASRYEAGKDDADARWLEASAVLERKAAASASQATKNEAPRIQAHLAQVAEEKERIDDAVKNGTSPFDVLFGGVSNGEGSRSR